MIDRILDLGIGAVVTFIFCTFAYAYLWYNRDKSDINIKLEDHEERIEKLEDEENGK